MEIVSTDYGAVTPIPYKEEVVSFRCKKLNKLKKPGIIIPGCFLLYLAN